MRNLRNLVLAAALAAAGCRSGDDAPTAVARAGSVPGAGQAPAPIATGRPASLDAAPGPAPASRRLLPERPCRPGPTLVIEMDRPDRPGIGPDDAMQPAAGIFALSGTPGRARPAGLCVEVRAGRAAPAVALSPEPPRTPVRSAAPLAGE